MQLTAINTLQMASEHTFYLQDWEKPVMKRIRPKFTNSSASDIHATAIREGLLNRRRKSLSVTSSNSVHKYAMDFSPQPTILFRSNISANKLKALPTLATKFNAPKQTTQVLKKRYLLQKKKGLTSLLEIIKISPLKNVTSEDRGQQQTQVPMLSKEQKSPAKPCLYVDGISKKNYALKLQYVRSFTSNNISMINSHYNNSQMENQFESRQVQRQADAITSSIINNGKISLLKYVKQRLHQF